MEILKDKLKKLKKSIPNPLLLIFKSEEEITDHDNKIILEFIINNDSSEISLILSGGGGHLRPTLDLAVYLRQKFKDKLITYIPKQASSALAYIVLISNKAYCCNETPLSQFDLNFIKEGKEYRAKNELNNKDQNICSDAHFLWGQSCEILKNILSRDDSISSRDNIDPLYLSDIMNLCMRDSTHLKPIRLSKLKKLDFEIELVEDDDKKLLEELYEYAINYLTKQDKKFIIGNEDMILTM